MRNNVPTSELKQRVDELLQSDAALHFRDRLRSARATALRDAENFEDIVFCVESLGQLLLRNVGTLGSYRDCIRELADRSVFGNKLPTLLRGTHIPFDNLYKTLTNTRNDAFHQGVRVRHLTESAVQLSIVLEDALMTGRDDPKDFLVSDFMVRNPIQAELWQPVSLARQLLLVNSFSYLPILMEESGKGVFHLISDYSMTQYLRSGEKRESLERLARPLAEVLRPKGDLASIPASLLCKSTEPILRIMPRLNGLPFLVVDNVTEPTRLEGILTAYDLL